MHIFFINKFQIFIERTARRITADFSIFISVSYHPCSSNQLIFCYHVTTASNYYCNYHKQQKLPTIFHTSKLLHTTYLPKLPFLLCHSAFLALENGFNPSTTRAKNTNTPTLVNVEVHDFIHPVQNNS